MVQRCYRRFLVVVCWCFWALPREVAQLAHQIRLHHSIYNKAQNGELVARMEALPLMIAYRKAEQDLRALCAEVDRLIGAQAGLSFSQYIRPQGHG